LANFCGRGLVTRENRPIKLLNHDTQEILSFATFWDISFWNTQWQIAKKDLKKLANFIVENGTCSMLDDKIS